VVRKDLNLNYRKSSRIAQSVVIILLSYLLTVLIIYSWPWRSAKVVFTLLGMPLILSSTTLGLKGGLILGAFTGFLALPFISLDNLNWLPLIGLLYLAVGGALGRLNQRQAKRKREGEHNLLSWGSSLNIMQLVDPGGNILESNRRAQTILGQPRNIAEFLHPDDRERAKAELAQAFAKGETTPEELRIVSPAFEIIPVKLKLTRLDPSFVCMEMQEIAELKELERKLHETEARYRYLIEDAIDTLDTGILLLDKERRIFWANKTIGNFFNFDRDELIGLNIKRVLASLKFAEPGTSERIVNSCGDSLTFTLRNGFEERILEYRSIPIETERYKGGRIDHYIDITEKKKLERSLQEKTKRLLESNKKLEEFTHVVSHDLKEPLRSIEAFSQFLLEDYGSKLDAEGLEYLKSLQNNSIRMKNLIEDLLKLSSIGTKELPLEKVEVAAVLEEVRAALDFSLNGVELKIANGFPTIMANRTRIAELFSNLLSNAVKYNDKPNKMIEVGWEEEDGFYRFYVQDNGMGIEERYLERIFELFERLNPRKDDYESTGAGLAICKRIVEEYGGKIWATSKVGLGSTFYFTIPKRPKKGGCANEEAQNIARRR